MERLVFEDLIYRCPFAISWHAGTEQGCHGRRNVNLTNGTFHIVVMLDAVTGSNENWRNAGAIVAFVGGETLAVFGNKVFTVHVNNVAGIWAVKAEYLCILVVECHSDDTVAVGISVSVKVIDDLFFYGILVFRFYDTEFIATLEVDPDIAGTNSHSLGLFPVDVAGFVAVFVFLHNGPAEFLHDACTDTTG